MFPDVDKLAAANLISSSITAITALYIAYVALTHTARPNISVRLLDPDRMTDRKIKFIFEISNVGYWYAAPPALSVIVNCNFDNRVDLIRINYGSEQELTSKEIRIGKNNLRYFTAQGLDLAFKGEKEQVHVEAEAPNAEGTYTVAVNAYSANGANFKQKWKLDGKTLKVLTE